MPREGGGPRWNPTTRKLTKAPFNMDLREDELRLIEQLGDGDKSRGINFIIHCLEDSEWRDHPMDNKRNVQFWLEGEMWDKLQRVAKRLQISKSKLILWQARKLAEQMKP